jgi:acyl dehydratase
MHVAFADKPGVDISRLPVEVQERMAAGEWKDYDPFVLRDDIVRQFVGVTGDNNLIHLHDSVAQLAGFAGQIAHGDLVVGLLPTLLEPLFKSFRRERVYPVYLKADCTFHRPVLVGESIKARVKIFPPQRKDRRGIVFSFDFKIDLVNTGKLAVEGTKELLCPKL